MLESIKRWLSGASSQPELLAVQEWAEERGYQFKLPREGTGFIVDAAQAVPPMRLEWGASQRSYIEGAELRLRAELGTGADLQMLLMSRSLMETLERQVFEQFTEDLQTRVDTAAPEEMRWLVLYAKSGSDAKALRDDFAGVSSAPLALGHWVQGALADSLERARANWLTPEMPIVLIVHRDRLTLRMPMPTPSLERIHAARGLFEVAWREARRVAEHGDLGGSTTTTPPTDWGGPPTQT